MNPGKYIKIIICQDCQGEGTLYTRMYSLDVKGFTTESKMCPTCLGKGRVKRTVIIIFEPLPNENRE